MNKEENVFVKPDEQNQACLGSAMERKDFHKTLNSQLNYLL